MGRMGGTGGIGRGTRIALSAPGSLRVPDFRKRVPEGVNMRGKSLIACAAASLMAIACSSARPVKIAAGDQCFRGRRIISDTRLAAESLGGSGLVSKFKAPGCMATYLAMNPPGNDALFVTDYATGRM